MTTLPWYHKTTIYQIYPRSFYDSNSDGIGDIQGILQKLDYLHGLGFESLWISPFFSSPQADFGYDISNYTDVAPEYGTLSDALQLIEEVHKRGMKIVFDMVMNHTSDQHPWFKESRSSRDNPKADWYLWRDKPNNWMSVTGGSGWHYAPERGQYFWASFLPFQPDLNYRNPEVKQTMLNTVRFWLGKGVDGFRLDIFNYIYKGEEFLNNPFSFKLIPTEEDYSGFFQNPKYTVNLPENFEFAKEFRSTCDEFGDKLSVGEVSGSRKIIRKFLGDESNDGLTLVFDFQMMNFKFTAEYFGAMIREMEAHYPSPFMPVYVFSNHDKARSIERLGGDMQKAKLLALLQLTVRGVPCFYYGEEIGMSDLRFPFKTALDPIAHKFPFVPRFVFDRMGVLINRDDARTPMQWNATQNAGFSSAPKTWLPVHPNFPSVNVEKESAESDSLLNTIRAVMKIRNQEQALQEGSLNLLENLPNGVLGYKRKLAEKEITVFMNFDAQPKEFAFEFSNVMFKLSDRDEAKEKAIRLDGFGGVIVGRN
ncbi:MAG: alpha-amylase family glycosyl hydrolase [Anaerolineales bacterium]